MVVDKRAGADSGAGVPPEEALQRFTDRELWERFEPVADEYLKLRPRYAGGGYTDHYLAERFSEFLAVNPTAHSLRMALEVDLIDRLRSGTLLATAELNRGGGRVRIRSDLWSVWSVDFGVSSALDGGLIVAWCLEIWVSEVAVPPRPAGRPSHREALFAALDRRAMSGQPTNLQTIRSRAVLAEEAGRLQQDVGWSDRALRRHVAEWHRKRN